MDLNETRSLVVLEHLMEEFFNPFTSNSRKHEIELQLNSFKCIPQLWKFCIYFVTHTSSQYVTMFAFSILEKMSERAKRMVSQAIKISNRNEKMSTENDPNILWKQLEKENLNPNINKNYTVENALEKEPCLQISAISATSVNENQFYDKEIGSINKLPLNQNFSSATNENVDIEIIQDFVFLDDYAKDLSIVNSSFSGIANAEIEISLSDISKDEKIFVALPEKEAASKALLEKVTKNGKDQKRKRYEFPLSKRKIIKLEEKRKKFGVKPPSKCKRKCTKLITEEQMKFINEQFWTLS